MPQDQINGSQSMSMDVHGMAAPHGQRLRQRDTEQLQDIIIRAHYLSMEMRDICAASAPASRTMCLAAAHMLKCWALGYSRELVRTATRTDSP